MNLFVCYYLKYAIDSSMTTNRQYLHKPQLRFPHHQIGQGRNRIQ